MCRRDVGEHLNDSEQEKVLWSETQTLGLWHRLGDSMQQQTVTFSETLMDDSKLPVIQLSAQNDI